MAGNVTSTLSEEILKNVLFPNGISKKLGVPDELLEFDLQKFISKH